MIRVAWKKPTLVSRGRGKKTKAHTAIVKGHTGRFVLYQTGKEVWCMWTLWDPIKNTQHLLYGENLKGAKQKAAERIDQILNKEKNE